MEWILLGDEETSSSPDGYIISFVHFHERGLVTPADRFLQGLLHYYKIELQHLNPQQDPTHGSLRLAVRRISGDQTPL
jgi:hypothetical protein